MLATAVEGSVQTPSDDLLGDFPGFIDDEENHNSVKEDGSDSLSPELPSKEEKEQELIDQMQQDLETFSSEDSQNEVSEQDFGLIESSDEDYRDEDDEPETVFELVEDDSADSDSLEMDDLETKLDVARVYMDMGSKKEAKRLLKELLDDSKASPQQHEQASDMLNKL